MVSRIIPEQHDRAFRQLVAMTALTRGADLASHRYAYDGHLGRFYDRDFSERSLAQTYFEIVLSGAERVESKTPESPVLRLRFWNSASFVQLGRAGVNTT